jgi:hypothetical protein
MITFLQVCISVILCSLLCIVYCVLCIVYCVLCIVHCALCILCIVYCVLCILCIVCVLCIVYCVCARDIVFLLCVLLEYFSLLIPKFYFILFLLPTVHNIEIIAYEPRSKQVFGGMDDGLIKCWLSSRAKVHVGNSDPRYNTIDRPCVTLKGRIPPRSSHPPTNPSTHQPTIPPTHQPTIPSHHPTNPPPLPFRRASLPSITTFDC